MQAATLLELPVKFDNGRVFIDGTPVDCVERKVKIPTGGGPVSVWLRTAPEADGAFQAVMCTPSLSPLVFSLAPSAATMLTQCASTVVDWMCRAARIEL